MKTFASCLVLMLFSLLSAGGQTAVQAQKMAIAKYPDLAHPGTPLHSIFVQLYREADAQTLAKPNWPILLADKAAGMLAEACAAPPATSGTIAKQDLVQPDLRKQQASLH